MTVWYRGIPHTVDLVKCRRALVQCQVVGEFASMDDMAAKLDLSRSTICRFFGGYPPSVATTLRILRALHLLFENVASQAEGGAAPADS